jgi:hypothetical protein
LEFYFSILKICCIWKDICGYSEEIMFFQIHTSILRGNITVAATGYFQYVIDA